MENREDILKELKEIAPTLSSLEKVNPYKVPGNYFLNFRNQMLARVKLGEAKEELQSVAPVLSKLEKVSEFEVPADYFSTFPQQMLKKVSAEKKGDKANSSWMESLNVVLEKIADIFFKPKYAYAFAGTVSIVIMGVMMFIKVEQCKDLECKMASLTDAEINAYLDSNAEEYSDEVFETALDESVNGAEVYKDVLKDISDEELDNAILD